MINIGANTKCLIENTPDKFNNLININAGENCNIHIKGIKVLNNPLYISIKNDCSLIIEKDQLFNGSVSIMMLEPSSLEIGMECLWATNVRIWTSDMHPVYDLITNSRINPADNIFIGDRVWFGESCLVLKGSKLLNDCIVGAHAVVTKSTQHLSNSLIAGNPGKVVKTGIYWKPW